MNNQSNLSQVPTNDGESRLFASEINTVIGFVRVIANNKAIVQIGFFESSLSKEPSLQTAKSNRIVDDAIVQLEQYFSAQRRDFDLPLAPLGTPFQHKVWRSLQNIQYGKTACYSAIANTIGNPKASRAVGAANGKNPIAIIIPCHRIIGANGSLTGYAGGLTRKTFLLNLEQAA